MMRIKTIAMATAFALSSTLALAQADPAASKGTAGGGGAMKNGTTNRPTTGSSMPSGKDASTQGANTAGPAQKKGDAASPGGTMKK
jgi:hypothetical protein